MPRRVGDRRQASERARDKRLIAMYYLQQKKQKEIADLINLDQSTVSKDLKEIEKEWKEERVTDLDTAKKRELKRIDLLEEQYWQSWENSKRKKIDVTRKLKGKQGSKAGEIVVDTSKDIDIITRESDEIGDPRFLDGVYDCIKQRSELMGLNISDDLADIDLNLLPPQIIKALSEGRNLLQALLDYAIRTNVETKK